MKIMPHWEYRVFRTVLMVLFRIAHPVIRVHGREKLPEGAAMLCCNHSSFSDPIWVIIAGNFDRLPRTMAKKELSKIAPLWYLYRRLGAFAVDRGGRDVAALQTAMHTLRDGDKVLIFPEGTRVRPNKEIHPHNGAVMLAARQNVPLVPIYLTAKKRFWGRVDIVFGDPITYPFAGRKASAEELDKATEELMATIYAMGEAL